MQEIHNITNTLLVVVLIIMILCILSSIVFASKIGKNFNKSAIALERLAEGDLTVSLDAIVMKRTDESGEIARAVTHLSQELKELITKINRAEKRR